VAVSEIEMKVTLNRTNGMPLLVVPDIALQGARGALAEPLTKGRLPPSG